MNAREALLIVATLSLGYGACKGAPEPQPAPSQSTAGVSGGAPPVASVATAPMSMPSPPPAPSASGVTHPLSLREQRDIGEFTAPPHPPADNAKEIAVSSILIAYKDAKSAAPGVTRNKEAAMTLAEQVGRIARAGADFTELALKYSDDPSVKDNRGSLGKFSKGQLEKPLADVAFGLMVMEISADPIETPRGFQIIRRTE